MIGEGRGPAMRRGCLFWQAPSLVNLASRQASADIHSVHGVRRKWDGKMNITGLEVAFGLSAIGLFFLSLPLVGLVIDRRRHSAGLRAVAAREAETEPASQRPPCAPPDRDSGPAVRDLLLSDLPAGDREHILWATTLDSIPLVPARGDAFGQHADAALALTAPRVTQWRVDLESPLAEIEARLRAGLATIRLPAWAVLA